MSDNILPAFYPNYMIMVRAKSWSEIMVRCNLYFHSLIFWILSNFTNSYQVSNHYGTQVWQLLSHNIVFFYNEKSSGRSGEKRRETKKPWDWGCKIKFADTKVSSNYRKRYVELSMFSSNILGKMFLIKRLWQSIHNTNNNFLLNKT